MAFKDFLPGIRTEIKEPVIDTAEARVNEKVDNATLSKVIKTFRPSMLTVANDRKMGLSGFLQGRSNFESAPYDFDKINRAVDTDSYAQQAFSKYRELMWKSGWDIVGKNDDAVAYLWKRINLMEVAMRRSFYDFLVEAIDQLVKFNNVFIVKARGDLAPFFPGKLYNKVDEKPVIGYYVLPTEKVEIQRDKNNKPIKYKQRIDDAVGDDDKDPEWPASEVIHLTRNRKPGRIFGTPFVIAALDDILAVRQIEEDVLNLLHRELFPLYFYKVGTDQFPADDQMIAAAQTQLEQLRVEGGIIAPHIHELEVIGSEQKALKITDELQHFKERVAIGLGVFPHHLGMTDGANRDATDRLDTALYDKVKEYQKYIAEEIRRTIFNELLIEGGFDPYGLDSMAEAEDRCMFTFNEIDIDTQIKTETHELAKLDHNVTSVDETRRAIGKDNELGDDETMDAMKKRIETHYMAILSDRQAENQAAVAAAKPTPSSNSGTPSKKAPSPSNIRKPSKGDANIIRPSNQHGTRTSPRIRHASHIDFTNFIDNDWLDGVESLLDE